MTLPKKKVFVTVGTTKFDDLIEMVLSPEVLQTLSQRGYNQMVLQVGKSLLVPDCTPRYSFMTIEYFTLSPNISEYVHTADLVISHAGAGSILDALEARKPLIVVANQHLMDNHQLELSKQLHIDEHLFYCICETLLGTIEKMDLTKLKPFLNDKSKRIAQIIDEVMGFDEKNG